MDRAISQAYGALCRLNLPKPIADARGILWHAIVEHQRTNYKLAPICTSERHFAAWGLAAYHPNSKVIARAKENPEGLQVHWECQDCGLDWWDEEKTVTTDPDWWLLPRRGGDDTAQLGADEFPVSTDE